MHPQYYKSMLTNAIVEVNFTRTHWTIGARPGQGGENVDAYTPELYSMRELRKPLPSIVSPPQMESILEISDGFRESDKEDQNYLKYCKPSLILSYP